MSYKPTADAQYMLSQSLEAFRRGGNVVAFLRSLDEQEWLESQLAAAGYPGRAQYIVNPEEPAAGLDVKVFKKPDDPMGLVRLSIGGHVEAGFYCVYRGKLADAQRCLALVNARFQMLEKEAPLDPRDEA